MNNLLKYNQAQLRRLASTSLSWFRTGAVVPSRRFGVVGRIEPFVKRSKLSSGIVWSRLGSAGKDLGLLRHVLSSMPPSGGGGNGGAALTAKINSLISENTVIVFSKTTCPYCTKVKNLLTDLDVQFKAVELDTLAGDEGAKWQEALHAKSGQRTVPNVFIRGQHIGGCSDVIKAFDENKLVSLINGEPATGGTGAGAGDAYDYDLVVIGGGSGGLAASKAAAKLGKKVAVCDYVQPTPSGTTWGLGGTCVNVGCIPKKLMHQAAIIGQCMGDAPSFGWKIHDLPPHDWPVLVENVQNYIKSLNFGYRLALRDGSVTYLNEYARFVDKNTIETTNKKGQKKSISSNKFIIAVGGRPRYPNIPGASEYAITSDDLFSLPYHPGKVLCIGASYIALECAGFLAGIGIDTSVMVRSILLRGFDQQIAGMIDEHMESHGVKFHRGWVPTEIKKVGDGSPPQLVVVAKESNGDKTMEVAVNTVLFAVGRDPCTNTLNLENVGVKVNAKSGGKILTTSSDQTTTPNIYAIGDVALERPELTPVAIQAGILLIKRLYEGETTLTDYTKIPTTVFTPMEYGCIGLSEEDSKLWYGDNVEVFHNNFQPLEAALSKRDENKAYCKLVCNKADNNRVVGFHYLGPNAGEVTQGFAVALKLGATKADFDSTIGIHPTTAETLTTMTTTKSSGASATKSGC
ncbi:unnamed protein product [Orchesella dallaii]|uniref:thioredoxin-disulfide reductase (NADPH) n=1 Tax=Orchesella dallaii TaxID=48710 RepID=A0ABP1RQT9_9HEXA